METHSRPDAPIQFKKSRNIQAIREFRNIAGRYLNRMKARMQQADSVDALQDYEALIASLISVSWDQRSIERLITVLGRVKGHDQQKISINDQDTYQQLLDEIRQSVPRQLVDGDVKVSKPVEVVAISEEEEMT